MAWVPGQESSEEEDESETDAEDEADDVPLSAKDNNFPKEATRKRGAKQPSRRCKIVDQENAMETH